jgi:tRNA G18 (ribose-2'-O)-methylase SpoU
MYVLGPEDGDVRKEIRELAQHTVRLPTAYCLNVAVAGAIVMHDRIAKA